MREYIKDKLRHARYADLSRYDKKTGRCFIPKFTKPVYEIGKSYIVQLPAHLVNNPNSVEAINWNNGTSPKGNILKVYVSKILGNMIYVDSLIHNIETGTDSIIMWSGWLPFGEIHQILAV